MWGLPEEHWNSFFQASAMIGLKVMGLIYCRGQAGEKMRGKSLCYCLGGPPQKQFYSGLGKMLVSFYFKEAKG
jgi:hypothetical protein